MSNKLLLGISLIVLSQPAWALGPAKPVRQMNPRELIGSYVTRSCLIAGEEWPREKLASKQIAITFDEDKSTLLVLHRKHEDPAKIDQVHYAFSRVDQGEWVERDESGKGCRDRLGETTTYENGIRTVLRDRIYPLCGPVSRIEQEESINLYYLDLRSQDQIVIEYSGMHHPSSRCEFRKISSDIL